MIDPDLLRDLSGAELRARLRNRGRHTEEQIEELVRRRDTPNGRAALMRLL